MFSVWFFFLRPILTLNNSFYFKTFSFQCIFCFPLFLFAKSIRSSCSLSGNKKLSFWCDGKFLYDKKNQDRQYNAFAFARRIFLWSNAVGNLHSHPVYAMLCCRFLCVCKNIELVFLSFLNMKSDFFLKSLEMHLPVANKPQKWRNCTICFINRTGAWVFFLFDFAINSNGPQ